MWKFAGKMPHANPTASILCAPALSKCTWAFDKKHFVRKFTGKMPNTNPGASILCEPAQSKCTRTRHKRHFVQKSGRTLIPRQTFCASLRCRNAHGHVTRGILCGNLQGKCRTLIPRKALCASLRSRNAHGHVTRGILCGNLQGRCRTLPIPPRLNTGP